MVTNIEFGRENSILCFYLDLITDALLIPNLLMYPIRNFDIWVIDCISHEELHSIIAKEVNWLTSRNLDNLGGCFEAGYIHRKMLNEK